MYDHISVLCYEPIDIDPVELVEMLGLVISI